jgi:hypothetical protein
VFLGIKPHWVLFQKFFRVKPQPSANDPRVVGGADIQMREDASEQYLAYKLIDSNQDWKSKWFYVTNHHPELPKLSGKQPKHRPWWNIEPTMQEGIQLPELLVKIKALREAGLKAEHVAFSFMKRRVQPLMASDTLGYQYTGEVTHRGCSAVRLMMTTSSIDWAESSRTCQRTRPVRSPSTPPNKVSRRTQCTSTDYVVVVVLTQCACCRMT